MRTRRQPDVFAAVVRRHEAGVSVARIARELQLPYSTVRNWLQRRPAYLLGAGPTDCRICTLSGFDEREGATYAYLLGLYLGGG